MNDDVKKLKKRLRAVIFLTVLIFCAAGGSVYAWFTLSGMASTNVTPMGGSISNGDASLLISTSRLGPFDKNCELVLDGNPDTLKPLSTADLDHFYRAIAQNKDGIAVLYEAEDSQVDEDALHGTVYLKCENAPCDVYFDAENLNVGSDAQSLAAMRLGIRCMALVDEFESNLSVTATTVAWFSIADRARVRTMSLDIISGVDLRMDLDAHDTIEAYKKTLSFEEIASRIQKEKGFSMKEVPLEPVTTIDQRSFTFESGAAASAKSGAYLEFTLHFMAAKDMIVHLTSADSSKNIRDGTAILSDTSSLSEAMRISFEADGICYVYDPGLGDTMTKTTSARTFGLLPSEQMILNENNAMFSLKEGEDKAVLVHIWLEGTDPLCTDELKSAEYAIRLRFTGTDSSNQAFDH